MTGSYPTCPTCGQPVIEQALNPLQLNKWERRLVERLKKAGAAGVPTPDLFEYMYRSDPNGGPLCGVKNLHVRICQINKRKLNAAGLQIRATGHGGRGEHEYVLRAL